MMPAEYLILLQILKETNVFMTPMYEIILYCDRIDVESNSKVCVCMLILG